MKSPLVIRNLVKVYGRRRALDSFSLVVPPQATLGLVGENGSGKTTLMMTVSGFVRADGGEIDVCGRGPFDPATHAGCLGMIPQDSEPMPEARPLDLLTRLGIQQGLGRAEARRESEQLLAEFNLSDRAHMPFRALSHGMRKRVMTAQAFLGDPELVLLDEPFNGLDPVETERLRRFIRARRGRRTLVLSSHNLVDIEKLCTHVAFITKGRVETVCTMEELAKTGKSLESIYLEGRL